MANKMTAGAALVTRLKKLGVDYIFANSGTDFPPIIEGLAEAATKDIPLPTALTIPHEMAAMSMAHGYTLATGKPQAVMVHTNVGLANAAIGAINACTDNIPMLLFSGRTPTTEKGRFGSRTVPIGWGQEMFDQTALVREACKWGYELRFPEQVNDTVDRAFAIADSHPKGPTYISLPREVLCETISNTDTRAQMQPASSVATQTDIERLAELITTANHPVIFTQRGCGSQEAFDALSKLATEWAIPVCQYWATQLAIPTDHPMATSPDPAPLLERADLVIVIDALAPWSPDDHEPAPEATVVQIGPDPLFAQKPVRNFRADLCLSGDVSENLLALMRKLNEYSHNHVNARREATTAQNSASWEQRNKAIAKDSTLPHLTKRWVSSIIGETATSMNATVFAELGAQLPFMKLNQSHSWFESPHSGGLGFGFPAALGYKLAIPERLVIATVGDGSYMFANPVACHQIAETLGLSIVVVVMNNSGWNAVRNSVIGLYPKGYAAASNQVPLTDLSPSPDFTKVAEASRHWAKSVRSPQEFKTAFDEAIAHTETNKGLALIDARIVEAG